ncbi:MAG: signal transduction histidine kinase [Polaribacter sp.]|jgi:signal transduction histidine kinase
MESCSREALEARLKESLSENMQLQKELAVKSFISEVTQLGNKQDDPQLIYKRIFILLSEIIHVNNLYIAIKENNLIHIPFIVDQNDDIGPDLLREDKNPELRHSLTGYAIDRGEKTALDRKGIEALRSEKKITMIGTLPNQWLFLPFLNNYIDGGIVVQSYVQEDGYSYNDMSILAYVAMNVGHIISTYKSKIKIQQQIKALTAAQKQLVHSEKMSSIGQLAAGIAHEINNPLGYVNSNLNSLKEYIKDIRDFSKDISNMNELADDVQLQMSMSDIQKRINELKDKNDISFIMEDTEELIKECLFGMDKIKKIIQSLKNFSHTGEDKKEIATINECIKESIIIVWNELKYHCEIITDYGVLPNTYCYPNQLNQIFMNLFINAGHAIKEKGVITVKTECVDKVILISISDNGSGINEKHVNQLFNPFFTTKPVGQGTGLGLSISFGIIESHGGTIEVESELGVGTCFTIHLPVVKNDEELHRNDSE